MWTVHRRCHWLADRKGSNSWCVGPVGPLGDCASKFKISQIMGPSQGLPSSLPRRSPGWLASDFLSPVRWFMDTVVQRALPSSLLWHLKVELGDYAPILACLPHFLAGAKNGVPPPYFCTSVLCTEDQVGAQSGFYPVVLPPPNPCPLCSLVHSRGHISEHGTSVVTLHLFQPSSPCVNQVSPCPKWGGKRSSSWRGRNVKQQILLSVFLLDIWRNQERTYTVGPGEDNPRVARC